MPRGGARRGAGRPKKYSQKEMFTSDKARGPGQSTTVYSSAEEYLAAVVAGTEPADPVRVAAAKSMLPYQKPKTRVPLPSSTPKRMATENASSVDAAEQEAWRQRSAEVRAKHASKPQE